MPITDDFNRASLGSNWESIAGGWAISGSTVAKPTSTYTSCTMRRSEASFPNDHFAQADTEYTTGGDSANGALAIRVNGTGDCYYSSIGNSAVTLHKRVSGVDTYITDTAVTNSAATFYTIKLEAVGTTLTVYVDGVLKITQTDATLATGKPGCFVATGESALIPRFDNFSSTDASTATAVARRLGLLGVG